MKLEFENTKLEFYLKNYKSDYSVEQSDDNWCNVSIKIENKYLNYNEYGELLECCEVDNIYNNIGELLADELKSITKIEFIEPNIEFILYPKHDLREDENITFVKEGHEIVDISMDMKINLFIDGYLTSQSYSIGFTRNEIKEFYECLKETINKNDN